MLKSYVAQTKMFVILDVLLKKESQNQKRKNLDVVAEDAADANKGLRFWMFKLQGS